MRKAIPYGRQSITEEDIEAVVHALKQDYLTTGPTVAEFEEKFAQYVGSKYAVAVSNGTAALHLCALSLGINSESNVITSPITFAASANCVRYCNGNVFFADIDEHTLTLDPAKVEELIFSKTEGFFNGIIPVDFAGHPADLEKFREIADKHGLWIIEDACHAPGALFQNSTGGWSNCGDGSFADLAIFSFHPVKHIACGEGGMITTNNPELYKKLKQLRSHGMIYQGDQKLKENHGGWYMEMQTLGYNYRIPDILCALGISQLTKADQGIKRRRELAANYDIAFDNEGIRHTKISAKILHAYHLYVIQVDERKKLYDELRKSGIYSQIHYVPVHTMPYYVDEYGKQSFPVAENYYERCISLPMYPSLTNEEQAFVISKISRILKG